MKQILLNHFYLLLSFLLYSCVTPGNNSTENKEKLTETIRQLELKAISAEFKLDTAAIANLMHKDFIAVYPHKLQNKQQELEGIYRGIVNRQKEGETMDSLYLDDFSVQIYDNTAIATFLTVTRGVSKGLPYERRWRWYDVWVRENGDWKLVSIQGTPLDGK